MVHLLSNRSWLGFLTLGLPALLTGMGIAIALSRAPAVQLLAFTSAACAEPPVFAAGYNPGGISVSRQDTGFRLRSESWVEGDVCSAGTLNITASGELGGDELPELAIYLDAEPLATLPFNQQKTVAVNVSRKGRVFLSYLNDYYLADVRVASLSQIKLAAPGCQGFSVVVPPESAGHWYPQPRAASLVRDPPMTLTPCAAGELSMRLRGREGNGAFPAVAFKQGGKTLKTITADLDWQEVKLSITAQPLLLAVINPYGKTLADRNLTIEKLEFARQR